MKMRALVIFAITLSSHLIGSMPSELQGLSGRKETAGYVAKPSQKWQGFNSRPVDKYANPPVGPISGNVDIAFNAEFLYWYSNVSNAPLYLERLQGLIPQDRIELRTKDITWGWDPGLRLGLGTVFSRDGWDVKGEWTYFYNSNSQSKSVPNVDVALNATTLQRRLAFPLGFEPVGGPTFVQAKSALNFNQGLLALGRNFHLSQYLDLRPSFGVRGIFTSFKNNANTGGNIFNSLNPNISISERASITNKQHYWGVGLTTSLDTDWYFVPAWRLSNQVGLGLLYGKANVSKAESLTITNSGITQIDISGSYSHVYYELVPVFDINIGLGWDTYFCQKKYHLSFFANWENHFFYNFNQFDRFLNEISFGLTQGLVAISSNGNLILSGITLSGSFQF